MKTNFLGFFARCKGRKCPKTLRRANAALVFAIIAAQMMFPFLSNAKTINPKMQSNESNAPQLRADNIDEVLLAMTLEEKAQLLVGGGNAGFVGSGAMLGRQERLVPGAAGTTVEIPRLGIPATVVVDGPAGVHIDAHRKGTDKTYFATGFPVGTCLASTWNTALMRQVGNAIGNETREYGCDVILGPGMNLHRNPLCGRNFEYYSEDPVVTGEMAAAYVNGVQEEGVGVSAKHFAANSQETARVKVNEEMSVRALRELYLRGFEIMVKKSQPWTLMSSYNRINGVYSQNNGDLLNTIARKEWGFQGIVMTDWIGKRQDLPTESEVAASNDLMMPGYPLQVEDIVKAVREGSLNEKDVDDCARRMLQYIVKTPHFKKYAFSDSPDHKAHSQITRQSSAEGMVLLKNTGNTLPMKHLQRVALFGVNSYDFLSGGLGSGCVNVGYVVDMVQGLKNAGVSTTEQLTRIYQNYVPYAKAKLMADKNPMMWFLDQGQPKLDEIEITDRCVAHEEPLADAAIITIGRQAGEGMDRELSEFNLTPRERSMIERVSDKFHAKGKPVIVILNSGTVMETASWRDRADAILVVWQPGQEGGNSVADVLTGKVTPSGKLTMTWPLSAMDHPSSKDFPQPYDMYTYQNLQGFGRVPGEDFTLHNEDIYVGYRYFDTFNKEVAYPFGYGMSYTTFEYSNFQAKQKGDVIELSCTVRNTGSVAGKEVVEVFVSAPQKSVDGIEKPRKELKAFGKTALLAAQGQERIVMQVPRRLLVSYDERNSRWLGAKGRYTFHFAASAADVRGSVTLPLAEYSEKTEDVMRCTTELNLLRQE